MKRFLVPLLVLAFALAGTTSAGVQQGDNEISFSASHVYTNYAAAGSTDTTALEIGLGHFVTDELQLGIAVGGVWSEGDDVYSIGANAKYHFNTQGQIVPYVGANIGFLDADYADGFVWGPVIGAKFFVTDSDNVFLFLEYNYLIYSGDIDNYIDDQHSLLAGIGFKF